MIYPDFLHDFEEYPTNLRHFSESRLNHDYPDFC